MSPLKRFLQTRVALVLAATLARPYRALLFGGLRFEHDPRLLSLLRSREPVLFACWHQDFFQTLGYLSRHNARRPTAVLASASRDGGLMASVAAAIGFRIGARGSSARGGAGALLKLHRLAGRPDVSIAVVCDGPRPPARRLQPGIVHLASRTDLPLWLVRTSYRPRRTIERSWAEFFVPPMGARAVSRADGPIHVPHDLSREALERVRRDLEVRLNRLADEADGLAAGAATGARRGRVRREKSPENRPLGTVPPLP